MIEMIQIKEQSKEKKKIEIYQCPGCKVKNALYRSKTKDYRCRTCECVWEIINDASSEKI